MDAIKSSGYESFIILLGIVVTFVSLKTQIAHAYTVNLLLI
jgi:hypothetical protein